MPSSKFILSAPSSQAHFIFTEFLLNTIIFSILYLLAPFEFSLKVTLFMNHSSVSINIFNFHILITNQSLFF
jgi:hypothetical protein